MHTEQTGSVSWAKETKLYGYLNLDTTFQRTYFLENTYYLNDISNSSTPFSPSVSVYIQAFYAINLFIYLFIYLLATPMAYGSSQSKD